MILARFLALAFLLAHAAFAIFAFPVTSTTCDTCAYVVWRTDVAGTFQVNYGPTASYGSSTAKDSTLVTYQAQMITELNPGTTHHFQVVSLNGSSNSASSKGVTGLQYRVYRASGTCDSPGSLTKIAHNERSDPRWRGAGLWCYKVTALVSGQESGPTQITVTALSSENSRRFNGGTHQ